MIARVREESGDDGQGDRPACDDRCDESDRGERSEDGGEVVHGPFEAVGAPVRVGGDDVGEERCAGWDSQSTASPRSGAQDSDLPHCGRRSDGRGEHGRCGVAADGEGASAFGFVGECTAPKRATPASASLKPSIAPSARPEHRGSRSETMGAVP